MSLKSSIEALDEQIVILKTNLVSINKRLELASMALDEYTKLYARGKADLDQVIRAEEDLINTQKSKIQYLSQINNLNFSKKSLTSDLYLALSQNGDQ